ncbi:MAG TPA: hypothetical protein VE476_06640 [Propionibacteriaceae bacterium]|nr:hypothetical protein [Propionibacteriaceae bacterium]
MPEETIYPAWHQALAYAVTGQSLPDLGRQRQPDVPTLAAQLEQLAASRDIDLSWSAADTDYVVPPELMEGIGAAQFWAALGQLRRALGVAAPGSPAAVTADRSLTPEESRLMSERPPHH